MNLQTGGMYTAPLRCVQGGGISLIGVNLTIHIPRSLRPRCSLEHFEYLFGKLGVALPKNTIISCTAVMDNIEDHKSGWEIDKWLVEDKYSLAYVAIDDEDLFLSHQHKYITDRATGVQDCDINEIKKCLMAQKLINQL